MIDLVHFLFGHSSTELYTEISVSPTLLQSSNRFEMSLSCWREQRRTWTEPFDWSPHSKMTPGLLVMWTLDSHSNFVISYFQNVFQIGTKKPHWLNAIWGGELKALTVYCIYFDMFWHMFLTSIMHPKVGFDVSLAKSTAKDICLIMIDQETTMPISSTRRRANRNCDVRWFVLLY